jgi:hypothetical protein
LTLPTRRRFGLWGAVGELTERLPAGWVLIGGLMVQLHAIEHGIVDVRPTRDIDVLGEARPPSALPAIDAALRHVGFDLHDPDLDGYGHRYERDGIVVDVLAPDGIKPPPTLGGGVTAVGVPGGTQALGRSEVVTMRVADRSFELRRPTLLGAILIKARSLLVHADPASQRETCFDCYRSLISRVSWLASFERPSGGGCGTPRRGSTFKLSVCSPLIYSVVQTWHIDCSPGVRPRPTVRVERSAGAHLRRPKGWIVARAAADVAHSRASACRHVSGCGTGLVEAAFQTCELLPWLA